MADVCKFNHIYPLSKFLINMQCQNVKNGWLLLWPLAGLSVHHCASMSRDNRTAYRPSIAYTERDIFMYVLATIYTGVFCAHSLIY